MSPFIPMCAVIENVDNANGPDLIVATARNDNFFDVGRVLVFRQTPTAPNRFDFVPSEAPYLPRVGPNAVEAEIRAMKSGDFGPGSLPDVVIGFNLGGQQYVQVLRRTSTTAFEVRPETSVTNTGLITALTTGDFDNDGRTDVVTLADGPAPNLFLSRGLAVDGTLGAVVPVDDTTSYFGAGLVSMRNSTTGRLDLCTLLPNPAVRILQNIGGGLFGSPIDLVIEPPPGSTTTPSPKAVAIGNFPGVAAPYIACVDSANNQVVVFVDFGSGYEFVWSRVVSNSIDVHPISIVAADLEADGDDDLVVGFETGDNVVALTCITLSRPFAPLTLPSGRRPRFVTAGDIDGNGLPDILEVGGNEPMESHLRVIYSNCGGM